MNDAWESHEIEQQRAWLGLSHMARLMWLEQAKEFAKLALEAAKALAKEVDQIR